jgi:hypothetical protein
MNQHTAPVSERCIRGIAVAFIILALGLLAVRQCCGGEVRIAWDPPTNNVNGTPLTNLAGYAVYRGTASGIYPWSNDVGNVTTTLVSGLVDGTTYYFAATAYNTQTNHSDYSTELVYRAFTVTKPNILSTAYTASSGRATLKWSALKITGGTLADIVAVRILYGQTPGGPYPQASAVIPASMTSGAVVVPKNSGAWYCVVELEDIHGRKTRSVNEGIAGTNMPKPPTGMRVQ